jgi:hypothetical protein
MQSKQHAAATRHACVWPWCRQATQRRAPHACWSPSTATAKALVLPHARRAARPATPPCAPPPRAAESVGPPRAPPAGPSVRQLGTWLAALCRRQSGHQSRPGEGSSEGARCWHVEPRTGPVDRRRRAARRDSAGSRPAPARGGRTPHGPPARGRLTRVRSAAHRAEAVGAAPRPRRLDARQ